MTTKVDIELAELLLPQAKGKDDAKSRAAIKNTAAAIAKAMLPERAALLDLVSVLSEVQSDDSFKAVFAAAARQGVNYSGRTWKSAYEVAKAIVDAYPTQEPAEPPATPMG